MSEINKEKIKEGISIALNEQYGAAIKMLENDINTCPEEVWNDRTSGPTVWQIAYHTLYFLDRYLSDNEVDNKEFKNRTKDESQYRKLEEEKEQILTVAQIQNYIDELKQKVKQKFDNLDFEELLSKPFYVWTGSNKLSTILYNLRHLKLHVGALNARLRNKGVDVQNWVSQLKI